jgi:hypothetical protein
LIRVSAALSDMSDGLVTTSKRSNVTFITVHLLYKDDVDYFVESISLLNTNVV